MGVGIAYLDGPRLARSLTAASDWVAAGRDELNRINVFPVPDGDTGTNFTLTLRAVADALRALGDAPLGETVRTAARAAVLGARGNSGMMLAHFLLGFSEALGDAHRATTREIAAGIRRGADRLYAALDDPREGTILTVAREAAAAAERIALETDDVSVFMRLILREGQVALDRTPELMEVLREAGVVDAGGKGFVRLLEGVVRLIEGDPILPAVTMEFPVVEGAFPAAEVQVAADRDFRFCTEVLVRGEQLPPANEVRAALRPLGGSIVVAVAGDILKAHVHTDTPDVVFDLAARWGSVTGTKAEDMRAQHRALAHTDRRPVGIVVDSSCDLPDAVVDRHGINVVPVQVVFGERVYKDRVELKPDEFYRLLRNFPGIPTTSQPTPGDFLAALRDASAGADEVLAVILASALSGTYNSCAAAIRTSGLTGVHLVDSRSATLGLGLLALRAAELAESGWRAADIKTELERVRDQSGLFLTVDRFDNLLRSGRVSRGKAWLAGMLDLKPILELDRDGRVQPLDRVRGRKNLVPRVLQLLERRLTPRPRALRLGVVHADAPEVAERVRNALVAAFRPRECLVSPATPALAVHVGPGAWGVVYQVEDGTSERPGGAR
jgi:DegV family protein with EDD domain